MRRASTRAGKIEMPGGTLAALDASLDHQQTG